MMGSIEISVIFVGFVLFFLLRLQKIFQANPESYNGAIRDAYSWSQSITDVDVRVKVSIIALRYSKIIVLKKHLVI